MGLDVLLWRWLGCGGSVFKKKVSRQFTAEEIGGFLRGGEGL